MQRPPTYTEATDADLILSLRRGEAPALDELFRRYYVGLCRMALRYLTDRARCEDVVQDFFVSLWERRESLPDDLNAVDAYLRRGVRNRCLNAIRDRGRVPVDEGEVPETYAAPSATAELENAELKARIHAAIDRLPDRCRLVFTMSKIEDMSNREIADALDLSQKTVENQMTRAYKYLRQYLAGLPMLVIPLVIFIIPAFSP